jgi:hypothetical protein
MNKSNLTLSLSTLATLSFLVFCANTNHALAAKDGGTVYICGNAENDIKITANLSNTMHDQVAVVDVDGLKKVFYEYKGKKILNVFQVGAAKNMTLQIKKDAKSANLVVLEIDPETAHSQLAHSGEGVSITKFDASLSVPSLKVSHELVSCLETKWND